MQPSGAAAAIASTPVTLCEATGTDSGNPENMVAIGEANGFKPITESETRISE